MRILGIDPSQRHTGLCLLTEAQTIFHEIKTGDRDVLRSGTYIRTELTKFLVRALPEAYVVEKQLSVGGQMSALLFYIQMNVLEAISELSLMDPPTLMMPLPIQLQSYTKKRHGFTGKTARELVEHFKKTTGHEGKTARELVEHFKKTTGHEGRISIHMVDAFYLAKLGQDVLEGHWRYNLPIKEAPLTPWKIYNGDDKGTSGEDREEVRGRY